MVAAPLPCTGVLAPIQCQPLLAAAPEPAAAKAEVPAETSPPAKERDVGLRLRGASRMEVRGRRKRLDERGGGGDGPREPPAKKLRLETGAAADPKPAAERDALVDEVEEWAAAAPPGVTAALGSPRGICEFLAAKSQKELKEALQGLAHRRGQCEEEVLDWMEGFIVARLAREFGVEVRLYQTDAAAREQRLARWARAAPVAFHACFQQTSPQDFCGRLAAQSADALQKVLSQVQRRRARGDRDAEVIDWVDQCVAALLKQISSIALKVPRPCLVPSHSIKPLRISAGRAASAAGLHPYADVGEVFLEFLYQDLPELLLRDAALAGVEVLSAQDERARLLAKCGVTEALEKALEEGKKVAGIEALKRAKDRLGALVASAKKAGHLTEQEGADLQGQLDLELNLDFGERYEDAAIEAYEARSGAKTYGQQYRVRWPMPRGGPEEALKALPAPGTGCRQVLEAENKAGAPPDSALQQEAYFYLTGFTDAIIDVPLLGAPPGTTETLISEVKHRMGRIPHSPNLYDVVQLGSYCRILGCARGELVQCLRVDDAVARGGVGELHVTRLDFLEGSMHREGWDKHVLPGMYGLTRAVYSARGDEALRLRLLAADAKTRLDLVGDICPHLGR